VDEDESKNRSATVSRRSLLASTGLASAGLATSSLGAAALGSVALGATAPAASSAQAENLRFDAEYDIVVVGGGGGGLPAALFSRWLGNSVAVLEKAPWLGGTAMKAAFWYWVPNNKPMAALGLSDPKDDYLRYVARLSQPQKYDPNAKLLGLTEWEYAMCEAIYDSASPAAELLNEKGALEYRHVADVPDYWAELSENKAPKGRVLLPKDARASMSDGGVVAVSSMSAAARRDGVDLLVNHRVERVIVDAGDRVIGVEAATGPNQTGAVRVRARKAVIFATGGFTHDPVLRKNFLNVPIYGGCAAHTNEGDFVRIASKVGAQLGNMNYAWNCPVSLEKAVNRDPSLSGMFSVSGDSMIFVDKQGRRVVNEKLAYNELAQTFFQWDGAKAEYPNLVLISIWDQRAQDNSASAEYGSLIVPSEADDSHVIRGETLEELEAAIAARLKQYEAATGGLALDPAFGTTLKSSIERFNQFAKDGRDLDFHRGERQVEVLFNGAVREEPGRRNPTMWPVSGQGPFYAALVSGGTLDTKGGPRTNTDGQVLDYADRPIAGLYGVGNCVASASGRAYWAGGATLGPIIAFAYRAANAADREKARV
jgi:3-oxosteroid 1-dehydrogenase